MIINVYNYMNVCMHVRMYVRMDACMYACIAAYHIYYTSPLMAKKQLNQATHAVSHSTTYYIDLSSTSAYQYHITTLHKLMLNEVNKLTKPLLAEFFEHQLIY
jgi:hypothetical protein